MCLVIDVNCVPSVFQKTCQEHGRFAPVLQWVTVGKGRMVYGGKKYKRELSKLRRYLGIIAELRRQGRVIEIPSAPVDRWAAIVKTRMRAKAFNDEHLVAIVAISMCRIVCTDDAKADPYLKRRDLYPKGVKPPKIYRVASHASLLRDSNLVGACL